MLAINEVLQNRYRIVRQLGHGGMGAVYEARDERLGSAVALKEIIVEMEKIPTENGRELFRRAFEREAKLLANLHHEVFPRVMDYFSEQNRQFLIMELVAGDDLSERLSKNKKPFALEEVVRWADHLLDALDYLHTRNPPIFHRDIKPQNLKITSRGKIKLLDFGIAKSVDQTGSTITNQTFVGATLDYAPIEQILPAITPTFREFIILKHKAKATAVLAQSTDARCDLYAVGATFYHLLTNLVPVDSAKRTLDVWEGNDDPLPSPMKTNPDIPPTVSAWLLKALEIERENRFASAIEMQEALQTAVREAERSYKTAEKTFILEQSGEDEKRLMQAETENLLQIKQSQIKTEQKIILDTQASPTESSQIKPAPTQPSPLQEAATESLPMEISETSSSGSISKPELTGTAYFNEKLVEERKPEPLPIRAATVAPQAQAKAGFNVFWLIPVFAVSVLTIIGIGGGMFLMNSASPANSVNSVSNEKIFSPTPTPSVSPVDTPTQTPTTEPTQSGVETEKPKTTPAPTQNKTPAQNPVKTPQTQRTLKPKPTKDPGCVYNGDC